MAFESVPAQFAFGGPVGNRVEANIDEWLLRAPQSNPGMIEMFRLRDRKPEPQLVPWAGEFVGKYLISAILALRMSEDPRLREQVTNVVATLIATQAEDGYLGPFPKRERLLKHWDLWGHYHAIQALLMWHDQTGDRAALEAARKAGDLVCATYLDTGRRVFDAGDHEMNMAILTGMAMLYRHTGDPRHLQMAREVERDWERAGDYLRSGLDGREFYRSPRPRWESLHDLQGLIELWRLTGDSRYRDAFEHHWRSIRRWDRRNTGGFSSGEQATGNPYAPSAIETCCTVAWMALTIDYLRLTGDPAAADELELSTLNGGLGAQHPSGRWWTYNTPMDGAREASAHTIVFQARAGTPELNCCSVNGPRVPGMLSEWALMSAADGVVVNWLGAGKFKAKLGDGTPVTLVSRDDAWLTGRTEFRIDTSNEFTLRVRIPAWASAPVLKLNGESVSGAVPGSYAIVRRAWKPTDRLELRFTPALRAVTGANDLAGKVSVYRGPLLLAYDQSQNQFDEDSLPSIDLTRLAEGRVFGSGGTHRSAAEMFQAWLMLEVPTTDGRSLRLVNFASAGAMGARYRSWLPANSAPPAPAFTQIPPDSGRVPPGPVQFRWRGPRAKGVSYQVEFSSDARFAGGSRWITNATDSRTTVASEQLSAVTSNSAARVYWRVVSKSALGETVPEVPPAWFQIDPHAPAQAIPAEPKLGPDRELVIHSLRGDLPPKIGELKAAKSSTRDGEGTEVNGRDQMITYSTSWPEEDFTVSVRVLIKELPLKRIGQVFSAWTAVMDDPLRIVVDGGKMSARIEAGGGFSTPGAPVEAGRWYQVAAVKRGGTLTFLLDGRVVGSCAAPEFSNSQSDECALGGNPRFSGNEFLAARFADFRLYARALSPEELTAPAVSH